MKIEASDRPEQANEADSAYGLFRNEWLDMVGGGPGQQTGSLCGSGGGEAGSVDGLAWKIDSVRVRGIAAEGEASTLPP